MRVTQQFGLRVILVGVLFALVSCVIQTQKFQPKGSPEELVRRQLELGIGYMRVGEYARAMDKLNRALAIDPKSAEVNTAFGLLFQLEGEDALAEEYFKKAIRYDPDLAQAHNNYGAFLFAQKRYHEAVDQLSKAASNRFYQNRSSVFENLGVAYARTGNTSAAEESFNRAIMLNPEQRRALLELGEIRFDQRRYTEAQDLYRRHQALARTSAKSLWLCIRVARVFEQPDNLASCELALKNIFPASDEYKRYLESRQG